MAPTLPPMILKKVPIQIDPFEDDWETAYSRNDEPITERTKNAKLWSEANSSTPTYSLQLSSQSASTSRLPPSTALLPGNLGNTMTILKRPSPSASDKTRSISADTRKEKTLVEREREYEEARNRIYGITPTASTGSSGKTNGSNSGSTSTIKLEGSLEGLSLSSSSLSKISSGGKRGRGRGKNNGGGGDAVKISGVGKAVVEGVRAPRGPTNVEGGGFGKK